MRFVFTVRAEWMAMVRSFVSQSGSVRSVVGVDVRAEFKTE